MSTSFMTGIWPAVLGIIVSAFGIIFGLFHKNQAVKAEQAQKDAEEKAAVSEQNSQIAAKALEDHQAAIAQAVAIEKKVSGMSDDELNKAFHANDTN